MLVRRSKDCPRVPRLVAEVRAQLIDVLGVQHRRSIVAAKETANEDSRLLDDLPKNLKVALHSRLVLVLNVEHQAGTGHRDARRRVVSSRNMVLDNRKKVVVLADLVPHLAHRGHLHRQGDDGGRIGKKRCRHDDQRPHVVLDGLPQQRDLLVGGDGRKHRVKHLKAVLEAQQIVDEELLHHANRLADLNLLLGDLKPQRAKGSRPSHDEVQPCLIGDKLDVDLSLLAFH